jgi:hypothetical protein
VRRQQSINRRMPSSTCSNFAPSRIASNVSLVAPSNEIVSAARFGTSRATIASLSRVPLV